MATGRRCWTPTGWKATTPQAALALVLQPGPVTDTIYQQRGWVPLVLGDDWPLEWLMDHLTGPLLPEIALVGEPPAGGAIPEGWSQVAEASKLPQRPIHGSARLPALPGWDREMVRVMACSSGLHADGWLETPCRLVVALLGEPSSASGLLLQLYLPEVEQQPAAAGTVQLKLGSDGPSLSWPLQPGLNRRELVLPAQRRSCLVLELQGTEREQPLEGHDQRRLLAVLADLSGVHVSLEGHDVAAMEQE